MRFWWSSREQHGDLIAFEGGLVTIGVDCDLPADHRLDVEAHLPDHTHFRATLRVFHEVHPDAALMRRVEQLGYAPRRHVFCARVESPAHAETHLGVLLDPLPSEGGHHHRCHTRVHRHIRVLSPALPHFQAIASDLSVSGVALVTDGPLAVGDTLHLHLDFDEAPFRPLDVTARVRWCRQLNEERHDSHLAGLQFESLNHRAEDELEHFVKAALEREPGTVDSDLYRT